MDTTLSKNLATKNTSDFTVLGNGDAFISQRKVASLVGVSQQAIQQFCLSNNLDVKHGINSENLSLLVTNYAQKGNDEAISTLILFSKAGAKAYIYHEAGYIMEAKAALPQNFSEALQLAADQAKEIEILEEQTKLDAPKVKFADILTESSNTRCIRVWVKGMKSDYGLHAGEREVFKWLREKRYIFKDSILGNLPYAKYESNGLSYFSLAGFEDKKGVIRQSLQITGKGMVALTDKVIKHFSNEVEVA